MKLLTVHTMPDGTIETVLGTDSALLRPGEPVFVPQPETAWQSKIVPAVRISRLGTHISERNAPKYVDAVTAFHLMTPARPITGIPEGLIDRTYSPGIWQPADATTFDAIHTLTARRFGTQPMEATATFSLDGMAVVPTIATLTQWCTVRTGDVLLFVDHAILSDAPAIGSRIEADLDQSQVLNIRIK